MNKIELVLFEKEKELELLQQELNNALALEGDKDYEYASLVYPILGQLKQELSKLKALQRIANDSTGDPFPSYIIQILTGELQSLEIHVTLNHMHDIFQGPILLIRKMKAKYMLKCTIKLTEAIEQFLFSDFSNQLQHIGWKAFKRNKLFQLKFVIKTKDNMESFHILIARTLLEPFSDLIERSTNHYYLLIK